MVNRGSFSGTSITLLSLPASQCSMLDSQNKVLLLRLLIFLYQSDRSVRIKLCTVRLCPAQIILFRRAFRLMTDLENEIGLSTKS